jgi:hypothetical protein
VSVRVIIPYGGPPCEHRDAALAHVQSWYAHHLGARGAAQALIDAAQPWCKPRVINSAARTVTSAVLVLADADCIPNADALDACIAAVQARQADGAPTYSMALPYVTVLRTSPDGARRVIEDELHHADVRRGTPDVEHVTGSHAVGGCVVILRETLQLVRGMDQRFIGWGGEDGALMFAARTLTGRPLHRVGRRDGGELLHLWHPPAPGRRHGPQWQANRALLDRYRAAQHDADAMRALVHEAGHGSI